MCMCVCVCTVIYAVSFSSAQHTMHTCFPLTDRNVPRSAKDGVEDDRDEGGVETVDRRQVCQESKTNT